MPSVKEVEKEAFIWCRALTCIECGKLERVREFAFYSCESLRGIDLPSIKIVQSSAFGGCKSLTNAKFGKDLKSLRSMAFYNCTSLERIALPLKDGMITDDNIFQACEKLNHVDLVGGVYETVDALLLLEEWKNDMNEEIDAIKQILPNTSAGTARYANMNEAGGKAQAIRTWIRSVRRKYTHYKSQHRRCVNEATTILQPALPNDILFKNVLPFVELPSDTFEGED